MTYYYICETTASDANYLTLKMLGEEIEAETKEQAVKKYIDRFCDDLDPEEIEETERMEDEHYLAIPSDEVADGWFGHPEKSLIHPVLGR